MKTSSVDSNSQSPTPSPMKTKHSRFAMLRRLFEPWQWKRKKKSDRFEQTSRTLEREKKDAFNQRRTYSPLVSMKKEKGISTAADSVQSGWPLWHPAKHAVFARRRSKSKLKRKLLRKERERLRYASRRYRRHIMEIQL
ncbi:phosphatase and actin regulator 2 [Trichonephila clavipes]|nr:phosphatase and actin regulator 2 [Trichonephila clavipes]